jgi:hypothetical protein
MSTHDTDTDIDRDMDRDIDSADDGEIGHADENYGVDTEGDEVADEQAADAQAEEPVPDPDDPDAPVAGYFDRDDASDGEDEEDEDDLDTEGLADPTADPDAEADTLAPDFDDGDAGAADDQATGEAIALGPTEADVAAAEVADEQDAETVAATTDEPVIVELEDSDVHDPDAVTAEDTTGEDYDDGDESVLLTESEPGSVLPPPEDEVDDGVGVDDTSLEPTDSVPLGDTTDTTDDTFGHRDSVQQQLEPVGPDSPLDPGDGSYQERWSAIQGAFVDEPFRAVESAGALVAQMWHDFERSVSDQRAALDGGWNDGSTTDDLREAFKEYRQLYQRFTNLLESS